MKGFSQTKKDLYDVERKKNQFTQVKSKSKNKVYAQIILFILVSGALSGMLIGTDVYSDVHDGIVEVLCLSCLKLDPKTTVEFSFETATGAPHPDYVLDNLSKGIVFLHYSEDACPGCDIMLPVVQDLFSVNFEKKSMFSQHVTYNSNNMTYFYTNIDHATQARIDPFETYDIRDLNGLPMFTIVTVGYDKGIIKPKYTTLYGTLGEDTDAKRMNVLENVLDDALVLWQENIPGYEP
jgi:hypothetical protein